MQNTQFYAINFAQSLRSDYADIKQKMYAKYARITQIFLRSNYAEFLIVTQRNYANFTQILRK